jgi:hypothetical protein
VLPYLSFAYVRPGPHANSILLQCVRAVNNHLPMLMCTHRAICSVAVNLATGIRQLHRAAVSNTIPELDACGLVDRDDHDHCGLR